VFGYHESSEPSTVLHTGLRTGEAVGLGRAPSISDPRTITVRISRSRSKDDVPKTRNSDRAISLPAEVVAVLRAAQPLDVTADTSSSPRRREWLLS
jgi:integrase